MIASNINQFKFYSQPVAGVGWFTGHIQQKFNFTSVIGGHGSSQVHHIQFKPKFTGGYRWPKHMCNAQVITREQTTGTSDRLDIWFILPLFEHVRPVSSSSSSSNKFIYN